MHIGATWQIRLNNCARGLRLGLPPGVATRPAPRLVSSVLVSSLLFVCTVDRLTKAFIDCLYGRVKYHCHDDAAAEFITTAVRLLRQPKMDFHSCTLGIPSSLRRAF